MAIHGPRVSIARGLPRQLFVETLQRREVALVTAGSRDEAFFGQGWSDVMGSGSVRMRVATAEGSLSIPLPDVDDYPVTLRIDLFPRPFPRRFPRPMSDAPAPLPALDVLLNDTPIGSVPLGWNPERVGAYDIVLPRTVVRRGDNRLVLRMRRATTPGGPDVPLNQPGLTDGDAFALWYVSVQPPAGKNGRGSN